MVATSPWVGLRLLEPEQRIHCNRAVHAFNIPVSKTSDGPAYAVPDVLVRLKAEYLEFTDGRGRGTVRDRF